MPTILPLTRAFSALGQVVLDLEHRGDRPEFGCGVFSTKPPGALHQFSAAFQYPSEVEKAQPNFSGESFMSFHMGVS